MHNRLVADILLVDKLIIDIVPILELQMIIMSNIGHNDHLKFQPGVQTMDYVSFHTIQTCLIYLYPKTRYTFSWGNLDKSLR